MDALPEDNIEKENKGTSIAKDGWVKTPSLSDLQEDHRQAKNDHDSEMLKIDGYLAALNVTGNHAVPQKKRGSRVQPKLIRKQCEWRYPALSEPFLSTDKLIKALPVTAEDVDSARQNGILLNHQFNNEINKVKFIDDYVRTLVNEGTVVVRTGWEYEEETITEDVPVYSIKLLDQNSEEEMEIYQSMQEKLANSDISLSEDVEIIEALNFTQSTGMPHIPFIQEYEEQKITKIVKNRPTVTVCNNKNVIIDPTADGDVEKAKFIIYSFETSKADLIAEGDFYENLEEVNWSGVSVLNQPDHESKTSDTFTFRDDVRKRVIAYEYWGFWDINDDGHLKPIVATWVGDTMIRLEESPYPGDKLPFTVENYSPITGSIYGEPDAPLLEDNQKIVGAITRGAIDIMARNAAGQRGTMKNALDVTNRRKFERGLDYEFNGDMDPSRLVHTTKFEEVPVSAYNMINMQNAEAESMSGIKAFSSGISGNAYGENVGGIKTALDATAKREMAILRRAKNGIKEVAHKIAAMNGEFMTEEQVIRISNEEFVPISPEALKGRFDLELTISTPEEEQRTAEDLSFMLQTLGNNVDPKITYRLLGEIAELRKRPALAKELKEFEPQPDPMAQEKAALEIELLRRQIAEVESRTIENQADAQEKMAKARVLGSEADMKDLDYVQEESGVNQERSLEKVRAQAESQADTKVVEHILKAKEDRANASKANKPESAPTLSPTQPKK